MGLLRTASNFYTSAVSNSTMYSSMYFAGSIFPPARSLQRTDRNRRQALPNRKVYINPHKTKACGFCLLPWEVPQSYWTNRSCILFTSSFSFSGQTGHSDPRISEWLNVHPMPAGVSGRVSLLPHKSDSCDGIREALIYRLGCQNGGSLSNTASWPAKEVSCI